MLEWPSWMRLMNYGLWSFSSRFAPGFVALSHSSRGMCWLLGATKCHKSCRAAPMKSSNQQSPWDKLRPKEAVHSTFQPWWSQVRPCWFSGEDAGQGPKYQTLPTFFVLLWLVVLTMQQNFLNTISASAMFWMTILSDWVFFEDGLKRPTCFWFVHFCTWTEV